MWKTSFFVNFAIQYGYKMVSSGHGWTWLLVTVFSRWLRGSFPSTQWFLWVRHWSLYTCITSSSFPFAFSFSFFVSWKAVFLKYLMIISFLNSFFLSSFLHYLRGCFSPLSDHFSRLHVIFASYLFFLFSFIPVFANCQLSRAQTFALVLCKPACPQCSQGNGSGWER